MSNPPPPPFQPGEVPDIPAHLGGRSEASTWIPEPVDEAEPSRAIDETTVLHLSPAQVKINPIPESARAAGKALQPTTAVRPAEPAPLQSEPVTTPGDGFPLWPPVSDETVEVPAVAGAGADTPTQLFEPIPAAVPAQPSPGQAEPVPVDGGRPSPSPAGQGRRRSGRAESADEQWPPPHMLAVSPSRANSARIASAAAPVRAKLSPPRRPGVGLLLMLVIALLGVFFAWTSAEPFWLAVGHAQPGQATVTSCTGRGFLRRCEATFEGAAFRADAVAVAGGRPQVGAKVPARMIDATSRTVYVGDEAGLQVRWGVGLGLTLLCGIAIAGVTGARRLPERRFRSRAVLLCIAGPLVIFAGMLAAHF